MTKTFCYSLIVFIYRVKTACLRVFPNRRQLFIQRSLLHVNALALLLFVVSAVTFGQTPVPQVKSPDSLSVKDFSRLINEFSEEGGYFRSDNFTSNETAYLHVVDKMRQLGASGGAYLGV